MTPFELTIDRNVVPGCEEAFSKDASATLNAIIRLLPEAIANHDIVGADYTGSRGVLYYLKLLSKFLELRYPIPYDGKRVLARMLYGFITSDLGLTNLACFYLASHNLIKIIKKKDIKGLVLPWHPLYRTVLRFVSDCVMQTRVTATTADPEILKHTKITLIRVVRKARFYFDETSTKEIVKELIPKLEPYGKDYCKYQALLCEFLPVKHGKENIDLWLSQTMTISRWNNNTVSVSLWFRLWSRLAKHNIGIVDLSPHLPDLFTRYLQGITLGSGNPNKGSEHGFPGRFMWLAGQHAKEGLHAYMGKLIAYTLHLKQCRDLLSNFFQITETYFHPSNTGRHLSALSTLISGLGAYYGARFGREYREEVKYSKKDMLERKDKFVVDVTLPILKSAIYSKSQRMVMAAQTLLRNLASIHPHQILPSLLNEWILSLKNVTQSHRTMSALSCLGWLSDTALNRSLNPQGCTKLEEILWLALPGIDPVDLIKSGKTLMLYTLIFYTVPLIDARKHKGGEKKSGDEYDEQAQRATMCFEEWCPRFLDRILLLIKQQEGYSDKNFVDKTTLQVLGRCVRAFFSALSKPLAELCLKYVARFITGAEFWPASKYLGSVITSIGLTNPKQGLEVLLPLLTNKLIEQTADEEKDGEPTYSEDGKVFKKRQGIPGGEAKHCLYLLSQLPKQAGKVTLNHLKELRTVYSIYSQSESHELRSYAGRIMRSVLRALTRVYPTEYKGYAPTKWDDDSWMHWQEWGKTTDYKNLQISWHVPSELEVKEAAKLCQFILKPALGTLAGNKKDAGVPLHALSKIMDVLRGANTLMGDFEDRVIVEGDKAVFKLQPSPQGFVLRVSKDGTIVAACEGDLSSGNTTLRMHLAECLERVARKHMKAANGMPPQKRGRDEINGSNKSGPAVEMQVEEPSEGKSGEMNVKFVTTLAECISATVNLWQCNSEKLRRNYHDKCRSRRHRREMWGSKKCTLRILNLERAYYLHLLRREYASTMGRRYTAMVENLIHSLRRLCLNDFEKVRDAASKGLCEAIQRYPEACGTVGREMLEVIRSKRSTKEQLIGAVKVMADRTLIKRFQSSITNQKFLVEALFSGGCESHEEDKVQAATHALFLSLLSVAKAPMRPVVFVDGEDAAKERKIELQSDSKKYDSELQKLLSAFSTILSAGNKMHWRYRLVATSFLLEVMLSSRSFPEEAVMVFANGLLSDIFALRKLCIRGLTAIMELSCVYKVASIPACSRSTSGDSKEPATPDTMLPITSEGEWKDAQAVMVFDKEIKQLEAAELLEVKLDKKVKSRLGDFMKKALVDVLTFLQENHPKLAPSSGSKKKQGAAVDVANVLSSRLPRFHSYSNPQTGVCDSGFDTTHVRLLHLLFHTFPSLFEGSEIQKFAKDLGGSDEKEKQCLLAEIVTASMEYSLSGSLKLNNQVQTFVEPIIKNMLVNGNLDTVAMWRDCLACSIHATYRNPKRLSFLVKVLAESPFSDKKTTNGSAESYRQLRLLRSILDECSWRAEAVGHWVLKKLEDNAMLSHPYKQVRLEVGNILAAVTRASYRPLQARDKRLDILVQSIAEQLTPLLQAKAGEEATDKRLMSLANVAIQWMIPSTYFTETATFQNLLLPLFPAVLHLQQSADTEAADRAKFCATTWAWGSWGFASDENVDSCPTAVEEVLKLIRKMSKSPNWHIRKAVASYLKIFVPRHAFLISGGGVVKDEAHPALKTVKSTLINLLSDPQVEVREAAGIGLQTMLSSIPGSGGPAGGLSKMTIKMQKKLYKMSKTKIPAFSKGQKLLQERNLAIHKRHGGVLGLRAMILSRPYDVPEWLPHTLIGLAEHTRDPIPIGTSAKKVFQEFMRTHQDEWHIFEDKFTEDQLDTLRDCGSSLTYYA